jgi:hypothetical protein
MALTKQDQSTPFFYHARLATVCFSQTKQRFCAHIGVPDRTVKEQLGGAWIAPLEL